MYTETVGKITSEMPVPTSPAVIESKFQLKQLMEDSAEIAKEVACSICKEHVVVKEMVYQTPCAHIFHKDCLSPWLQMSNRCPTCRALFQ